MPVLVSVAVKWFGDPRLLIFLEELLLSGCFLLCSAAEERRIEIILNGERTEIPQASTVDALVQNLDLRRRQVAVEVNNQIISRTAWAECPLKTGDRVEIVHFVGGGEEG